MKSQVKDIEEQRPQRDAPVALKSANDPMYCATGAQLLDEWRIACRPCIGTRLEDLVLYEEVRQDARDCLVGHRDRCTICCAAGLGVRPRPRNFREKLSEFLLLVSTRR